MEDLDLILHFAIALVLGLFLGLERERHKPQEVRFAGVRTFGLIALAGALTGYLDRELGLPWLGVVVSAGVAGLIVVSYFVTSRGGDVGATTEFGALVTFLLGVLCIHDELALAASLTVVTGLLLSQRERLHAFAKRISADDVTATLKFAIASLIVLPLVPDRTWGPPPFDALNPYKIWLMIVLISGVDFASYVLVKALGPEHGLGVGGILGGLASSTALTLGMARRSKDVKSGGAGFALAIVLAWTVMFVRVIVISGVLAPALLPKVAFGLGIPTVTALVIAGLMWKKNAARREKVDAGANPFALTQAIRFGLLFAAVVFVAKAAQMWLGPKGLYVAGALSGSVDVDAITVSMANQAGSGSDDLSVLARTIEIAALSNTLVKGGLAFALGSAELRRVILPITLILAGACVAGLVIP